MFRGTLFCTSLLILALMPHQVDAQEDRWQVRIGGVWVDPDVNFIDTDSDGRVQAEADSELGFGIALERRFSPRLGLEVGALYAAPDLSLDANLANGLSFNVSDSVSFTAITAGLNIHLTPDKSIDVYLGPLLGYALYGDIGFQVQAGGQTLSSNFSSADEFALGAQVGADIPFGDGPWSLNVAAKYLDASLKVTDDEGEETDLGFDPLMLSVGFGFRF